MAYISNFHTHTTFCDGKDMPQDFVTAARAKGFSALGFSAHALYPFSSDWHLPLKSYRTYIEEILRLKAATDSLSIFAGFEADFFPQLTVPDSETYRALGADYIIGSVHYLAPDMPRASGVKPQARKAFSVDGSVTEVAEGMEHIFGGSGRKMTECYFENIRQMCAYCTFDIVGHTDLIKIRNGALHFLDESETWYKDELKQTARAIADSGKIVEINTGAIARKIMDSLYPSDDFLVELCKAGVPIVINSDAHSVQTLDFAFDRAREAALNAGYTSSMHLVCKNNTAVWESKPLTE